MKRPIPFAAMLALSTAPLLAQVPERIHWQSVLTNTGGQPVTGPVNLIISLYDVPTGGTALYQKDTTNVIAESGVVGVPLGPFPGVTFDGPLFLGLRVNGGEEGLPRAPLGSVPYAHRARALFGLRTEPANDGFNSGVNVLSGASINTIGAGVVGGTISGGGLVYHDGSLFPNTVTNDFGTVGGGYGNSAGNSTATVGGGKYNTASGMGSTVGGGSGNTASGNWATVGGGSNNTASGDYSFAAGSGATADHNYTFVWSDNSSASFSSAYAQEFAIQARNGVRIRNQGDGAVLLNLDSERYWQLRQFGSGSGTALELASLGGGGNKNFLITTGGRVGINLATPSHKLDVNGSVGATSFAETSDARLKTDVEPIAAPLDKIRSLRGVTYRWDRAAYPEREFDDGRRIGFLAQEVAPTLPEIVSEGSDGYLSLDYDQVVAVLVEALKERDRKTESLEKRVVELERMLVSLADAAKRP